MKKLLRASAIPMLMAPFLALGAAFDCAKSSSKVEQIICADKKLSEFDEQLAQAYRSALRNAENPSDAKNEQLQWLKEVRGKCADASCLATAYRKRIQDLSFDCVVAQNDFDKLVCSTSDKKALAEVFQKVLDDWKPYLTKLNYFPSDQSQALSRWYEETKPLYRNWTKGCLTLGCERARIAEAIKRWTFPKLPYEALLKWVESEGAKSPLLAPDRWKLSSAEAVAVWGVLVGRIYLMGPRPAWLSVSEVDTAPSAEPPFFGRGLTYTEAVNLNKLASDVLPWTWGGVTVAGITEGMRNSLHVSDGGSAKCSRNPLYSGISVSGRFPDPPDTPNPTRASVFKIVEVRKVAFDQAIPGCAFGDAFPEGFFPRGQEKYKSRILIDDVGGQFIRPDGSFWLKLSDDNWYRFRRDMTSGASEIGSKYYIFLASEFEAILDKSKNVEELDKFLVEAIERRKALK